MRISGFASGFDIDAIVKQLMKAHQAPVDKLKKQTTRIEWQQEAYRSISTTLVDFRNNKLANFGMSSSIDAKRADISGNTSAISVTTTGTSVNSVMSVVVKDLASAASVRFNTGITEEDADRPLSELWQGGEGIVTIGGVDIEYSDTDTIKTLISKINNNKEANVTAIYDDKTGQMSITSKKLGEGSIELGGDLTVPPDEESATFISNVVSTAGKDASAIVNGIEMRSSNNQITVNGTTIQLKQISDVDNPSTVTVSTNTDKIVETIQNFIAEYNKVLELINGKLGEERYRNYAPLTEEEQEAMTDKQIELWESRARSGLLKNDSILSQTVSNLRMAATANFGDVEDRFNIQSIGISTGKWFEGGKLVIENEQMLRDAIEADPEKIMQLFTARSSSDPAEGYSKVNNPETGIFTRMSDILMDSLKQLSDRAGTSQTSTSLTGSFLESSLLAREKKGINDRITEMNRRLTMLETQYYKQFTAMEKAINRYNSQAGSLASFMG